MSPPKQKWKTHNYTKEKKSIWKILFLSCVIARSDVCVCVIPRQRVPGNTTGNTWSAWSTVTQWTPPPSTAPVNSCWRARGTRWRRLAVTGRTASPSTAGCLTWVCGANVALWHRGRRRVPKPHTHTHTQVDFYGPKWITVVNRCPDRVVANLSGI